jgi:hypothetical protein
VGHCSVYFGALIFDIAIGNNHVHPDFWQVMVIIMLTQKPLYISDCSRYDIPLYLIATRKNPANQSAMA